MTKRDLTIIFIDEKYSSAPGKNYPTNKIVNNRIDDICSIDLAAFWIEKHQIKNDLDIYLL